MIRRLALCCLLFQSTAFSQTFQEYCEDFGKLSAPQQQFVIAVLRSTDLDCEEAQAEVKKNGGLDLQGHDLTDISLIGSIEGIRSLWLGNNQIKDYSPLASLKNIQTLYIQENGIKDLGPFAALKSLSNLVVRDNEINDLTPIKNLTSLTTLHLAGNPISDFSSLKSMTSLQSLSVGESDRAKDGSCSINARSAESSEAARSLSDVIANLTRLEVFTSRGINFKSLVEFEKLKEIREFEVSCASIEETAAFAKWYRLELLKLDHNRIKKIDGPRSPKAFRYLSLAHNFIEDAGFVQKLKGLSYINLSHNSLTGDFSLREESNLSALALAGNQLKYLHLEGDFPDLWMLDVSDNILVYLKFANAHQSLAVLKADNNRLEKPEATINLKGVQILNLRHNRIRDYTFLNDLPNDSTSQWREIRIGGNPGTDFSVISGFRVYLFEAEGSNISDVNDLPDFTSISSLKIANNNITSIRDLQQKYRRLETLDVSGNPLRSGEGVPLGIVSLDISGTKIRDIAFTENLDRLYRFNASGIQLRDLSPIKDLEHLMYLDVSHNSIEDLRMVKGKWPMLRRINLQRNRIFDATPLGSFGGLSTSDALDLSQNPLGTTITKTTENCPTQSASSALNAWCSHK